jgi:hypothetical protein
MMGVGDVRILKATISGCLFFMTDSERSGSVLEWMYNLSYQ